VPALPSLFGIRALVQACTQQPALARSVALFALERARTIADRNVWIELCSEASIVAQVASATERLRAGEPCPLFGVPFAVKDNIDAAGTATTAGCPSYAYRPSRDAYVVQRLRDAGAILVGKTNMDQFATGLVGTRSPYGACSSALDPRYIAGGSSSGSALAVALGAVSFALGTDTAGSGRVPAAFNNIVGLKPTRGLLSTTGVVPACRSLDCVSLFAGCVEDARCVLDVAAGFDAEDPYCRRPSSRAAPGAFGQGVRFGVLEPSERELIGDAAAADMYRQAVQALERLGGNAIDVDFEPFARCARLLYEGPFVAERYAAVGAFLETDRPDFDPTVRGIILEGRTPSAAAAFAALDRVRALCRQAESRVWAHVDVLLLPTAPTHYRLADVIADPIGPNARLGYYTNFVNLMDLCGVAVPAGMYDDGLPFGVSLLAPAFSELPVLELADRLQRQAGLSIGATAQRLPEPVAGDPALASDEAIAIAVCGAHLLGQPLHHQLRDRGAVLVRRTKTAAHYRFFALNTAPPKPGLVYEEGFAGPGIEVEVWSLCARAFGELVASVPAPLSIGKVSLSDGEQVSGFVCEPRAMLRAQEITNFGGWRTFLKAAGA
jgi:allophanate hydrolase